MSTLLPFHKTILEAIHDPATSDLLILARGLGLRRVVCSLMQIYDSPQSLVLLVNATPEEESAIGEELGIMGCRRPGLRIVAYETPRKERCVMHFFPRTYSYQVISQELYKRGGLLSVTSRILVVDMLQNDIPIDLITGIMVLHAERYVIHDFTSASILIVFSESLQHHSKLLSFAYTGKRTQRAS
jgi:DNA excision repair protein ERCC-4